MMQFKAFKPEAMNKIAKTMGYSGDMSKFQEFIEQDPQRQQRDVRHLRQRNAQPFTQQKKCGRPNSLAVCLVGAGLQRDGRRDQVPSDQEIEHVGSIGSMCEQQHLAASRIEVATARQQLHKLAEAARLQSLLACKCRLPTAVDKLLAERIVLMPVWSAVRLEAEFVGRATSEF